MATNRATVHWAQLLARCGLAAILSCVVPVVPSAIGQSTTRISVSSSGTQANSYSGSPSISANGRFVAFTSAASNLVPGDTNGVSDVFVHDRQTGQTTRIPLDQGYWGCDSPSISADGRFVAFASYDEITGDDDWNNATDIFVHDRDSGETTRVSVASDGTEGNKSSFQRSSISADGRFVAFQSYATNLVLGDTNNRLDIFVHDRQTRQTTRVSVSSDGKQGNGHSECPSISADGRFVAFFSYASNLVPGDTNDVPDVFVHDRQTSQTSRVSVSSDGIQGNGRSGNILDTSISSDGRFIAFSSVATNLVSGDTNGWSDVFVHDRQTGQTTRVSVSSNGQQSNGTNYGPSISSDGRFVAFFSDAFNLVPGDTNSVRDVFVHDRQTSQTTRVSMSSNGTEGNGWSWEPSISSNGQVIAFISVATNLVPEDTNGKQDIFVHDRTAGHVLFGRARTADGSSLPDMTVQATGLGSVSTDMNGFYSLAVPNGWTGTVTPSKLGYAFSPASRTYSAVGSDQLNQDFTGTLAERIISGIVFLPDGSGMLGALVSATGRGSKTTDSNGQYSFTVPNGWSGTVTPSRTGYSFTPSSRTYSNVTSDRTAQEFMGSLTAPPPPDDPPTPPDDDDFTSPGEGGHIVVMTHGWTQSRWSEQERQEQRALWQGYLTRLEADRLHLPNPPDHIALYGWWQDSEAWFPDNAFNRAIWHGQYLGDWLGRGNYTHVHLIAHSAGSAVIGEASRSIRALSPGTTIHCTFLDPFTKLRPPHDLYGGSADWSDAYFANAVDIPPLLREAAYRPLRHAHNVEVSCLENKTTRSRHAWPHEWYFSHALDDLLSGGASYAPYGPGLSVFGSAASGFPGARTQSFAVGNTEGWPGRHRIGDECSGSDDGDASDPCWFVREQPKVIFKDFIHASGGQGSAKAGTQALELTSTSKDGAWFSLHVAATEAFNFIVADFEFTGPVGSQGFLSISIDDAHAGFVDQRFRLPIAREEYISVTDEEGDPMPPGEYVIGLRLTRHGVGTAGVTVTNLRLVHSGPSAARGDFNCDGVVDTLDFVEYLRAYTAGYPEADLTGSGDVGPADLIKFVDHFIRGER